MMSAFHVTANLHWWWKCMLFVDHTRDNFKKSFITDLKAGLEGHHGQVLLDLIKTVDWLVLADHVKNLIIQKV